MSFLPAFHISVASLKNFTKRRLSLKLALYFEEGKGPDAGQSVFYNFLYQGQKTCKIFGELLGARGGKIMLFASLMDFY